jgi:osmotically inducible protein OsmC
MIVRRLSSSHLTGDDATFQKYTRDAKQNCPVSKALAGTEIRLNAKLL